jgi:hypothetical protein
MVYKGSFQNHVSLCKQEFYSNENSEKKASADASHWLTPLTKQSLSFINPKQLRLVLYNWIDNTRQTIESYLLLAQRIRPGSFK